MAYISGFGADGAAYKGGLVRVEAVFDCGEAAEDGCVEGELGVVVD